MLQVTEPDRELILSSYVLFFEQSEITYDGYRCMLKQLRTPLMEFFEGIPDYISEVGRKHPFVYILYSVFLLPPMLRDTLREIIIFEVPFDSPQALITLRQFDKVFSDTLCSSNLNEPHVPDQLSYSKWLHIHPIEELQYDETKRRFIESGKPLHYALLKNLEQRLASRLQ
jgi:hypothetical protein